jgi:hypothetical protein
MYRQIDGQNYVYIHTFLILCTEFLACMHFKVCPSCTHDTKVEQTCVGILLIYCTVVCKYCKGTQESV